MDKKSVLFLCTHNSARSQMAEGIMNHLYGDRYQASSAGTEPGTVNPLAVKALAEIGIDISAHHSKHVREFVGREMDLVVTVCDNAREACPVWFGEVKKLHKSFEDPPFLAKEANSEEEALAPYRRVRDEIRDFVADLFKGDK